MRTRLPSRAKIGAAQLCKSKAIVAVMLLAVLVACGGSPSPETVAVPVVQEEAATSAAEAPTPLPTPSASPRPLPATPATPGEPPTPAPLTGLGVEPTFPALSLSRMVGMTYAPDGSDRLYVVLQPGRIVSFPNDPDVDSAELFLDIRDRVNDRGEEEGLLGLAFDPQYAVNGHLYVYYSASGPRRSVVSRFSASADGRRAGPASERVLLEVAQPFSNHNGGQIAFGQDGYLYIGMGDGGSRGDPQGNGQDPGTLLGSILRINVSTLDSTGSYAIPADNPFVGHSGARPEIWAYGLRNPWRFSFDHATGDLWTADVGQNRFEEVDIIRPGLNYGWNVMEGEECFARSDCDRTGLEMPVAEYGREDGCSVTGGYVYRGSRLASLYGAYVYGDYCSGRIWALRHDGDEVTEHMQIVDSGLRIPSFAEDAAGELYVLSFDGTIYRLVAP